MQHITKSNTTSSSPSDTGLLRRFYEKQLNGSVTLLQLRYHVWRTKGTPKDAYWEVDGMRVFSYDQLQIKVAAGTLEPADTETRRIFGRRPSQLAEALAAAA